MSHPTRSLGVMVILREFLYRRDDLVAQFLEQIEGGEYDEERMKEQAGRKSAVGGSAALGAVSVTAERRRDGASETELTMRQTAASRFNRLHALLSKGNDIQPLTSFDNAIWAQIASGEVVELEGTLTLLPGVLEMGQAARIGSFLPLIETMKDLPDDLLPDSFDRGDVERVGGQLSAVQGFAQHLAAGPVPCTVAPTGAPTCKLFVELRRDSLQGDLADLEGDVIMLARITRKISKGKPETVGQPIPGVALNREQRRKGGNSGNLTVRLQHPAAVVSAIAIYR